MPQAPALWDGLRASWMRSLAARKLAPATLRVYGRSARIFTDHLAEVAPRVKPADVTTEHVETFMVTYGEGRSAATLSVVYRALQQWFAWMVKEDELEVDPTARMQPPLVPEKPVPVLSDDELRTLLMSCEGKRLVDRRDMALFRLLIDTGGRLTEISQLAVADVDLDQQVCRVLGKGRRERLLPFGVKTAEALDRYLRARQGDRHANAPGLWLGEKGKGPLTPNGVYQLVKRRGQVVGMPGLHPHQFRHTAAHRWLSEGGNEGDLMQIAGWRSRSMLTRYAASAAAQRAREAHKRMGLGDRL